MAKKQIARESGIEMLRMISMLFVIILHYNSGRAFEYVHEGSINFYVLNIMECVAICAVDLFVLISGYFLSATQKEAC